MNSYPYNIRTHDLSDMSVLVLLLDQAYCHYLQYFNIKTKFIAFDYREFLYPTDGQRAVWPDLAKFRHFGKILKDFGEFKGSV